ncbi:MAG: FAD-dependent monooxygenase [Pseudomonadota bacterium]
MLPRVLVVGAGIGGLALASLLHKRGFPVRVYEQSSKLQEVGAGVQLSANAVKVLRALGVERDAVSRGFLPKAFIGWSWKSGRMLYRTPLAEVHESQYGAPYVHIHRADLHDLLASGVPAESISLGHRVRQVIQDGDSVRVEFENGHVDHADVVIGADGIHSAVRRSLFGDEAPRFTGNMCWRGVIPADALPQGHVLPVSSNWMGPDGHVVTYFLRSGTLINFVAIRETQDWTDESWTTPSSREELLEAFKGWNPRLLALFQRAEGLYKWGLFDRDPLARWSMGRVTLLGDAAHPMLPFLAQGAAQALEDGYALGDWLSLYSHAPVQALAAYEAERRPRTARVQLGARERGRTAHLRSAWARFKRDLGFLRDWVFTPKKTSHRAEWIFAHDVTRVTRELPT